MANSLTAFNPEYWTPTMQETFLKESVALGVANTELRADLKDGDTLHKPYGSYPRVQTYTKGTDITVKDISSTDDTLTVGTAKVASFYVDDIDRVQGKYAVIKEFSTIAQRQLNNTLDQAVMAHYSNAGTTLDAGDVGGTAGNGIVFSQSNAPTIFGAMGRTLNSKKRLSPDRFTLVGPRMLETIVQYTAGRETGFGDVVGNNGLVGRRFGFDIRLTNNLPFTATLDGATIFGVGNTIIINGVTFTAATDGAASAAGSFSRQGSASLCIAQLASAINDDDTPGVDTYIALSAENRQLIEEAGIVATINGTDLELTGYGDIVVGGTHAGSGWSAQTQYSLSGVNKSIDLVTQVSPNIVFRDPELRLGKYIHPWMLYGTKTFFRMQDNLVATTFDASSWQ